MTDAGRGLRKSRRRVAKPRPAGRVTIGQVLAWVDEQLAKNPALRRRFERRLAALRAEQTAAARPGSPFGPRRRDTSVVGRHPGVTPNPRRRRR